MDSHVPVDMETFWNHQIHDVAPNILCCKESAQCMTYFGKRPSDEGCIVRPPGLCMQFAHPPSIYVCAYIYVLALRTFTALLSYLVVSVCVW